MNSLDAEALTSVSCRKIIDGCVFSSSLRKEASFRGPPTTLMLRERIIMYYLYPGL
jgi:hypothetical protein